MRRASRTANILIHPSSSKVMRTRLVSKETKGEEELSVGVETEMNSSRGLPIRHRLPSLIDATLIVEIYTRFARSSFRNV